jgi:glycosyltransferase involved in cell wall biosynthesis
VDGLEIRPPISQAEVRELLRACRVVALPSRAEAMPMILLEAMGVGRPFVATPVGDIPQLAEYGGTLVPVNDVGALSAALVTYLKDGDRADRDGSRGREDCASKRGVEQIAARMADLYGELA